MADSSILTPNYSNSVSTPTSSVQDEYLLKDNFLSEFQTEGEKGVVRDNLNVPSKDSVYTKQDTDKQISEAIYEHLLTKDPHNIISEVVKLIEGMVKQDGSTEFKAPQQGVDPIDSYHLTTKNYVDKLLQTHIHSNDPHSILPQVQELLKNYAKLVDIYTRDQVYDKTEINVQSKNYINKDGSIPFSNAQVGVDPEVDEHLTTKRYVDSILKEHKEEINPHGFLTILNDKLSSYIKREEVYDKTQTYSREQLDSIINSKVDEIINSSLEEYTNILDSKINRIESQQYVKSDGSVPFKQPQYGVDATQLSHLTTLRQLNQAVDNLKQDVNLTLQSKDFIWKPSGPVEATVGYIKDNTIMPETMSLQEILDAIFYGRGFRIEVPRNVNITQECPITIYVKDYTNIDHVEVYQNGVLIYTLQSDDFIDGSITVNSQPMQEDTTFLVKLYSTNGTVQETSQVVKCNMPVFVGLLPKWKTASTITMEYLEQLASEDFNGTQNRFFNYGKDLTSITFKYTFEDPALRHLFVVLPVNYPNLESLVIKSQSFGLDAFDIIDSIPLHIKGVEDDTIYKIYVYRQALSSLDQKVTYNFE